MTQESNAKNVGDPRDGIRLLLLAFPVALLLGSLALLITSPFSWNAGEVLELPAWMPPLIGFGMALAGIAIALYAMREVAKRTYGPFEVMPLQLVFGMFMFVVGAVMQVVFAMNIGASSTYERGLDPSGEPEIAPSMFMFGTAFLSGMLLAWVWAAAFIYVNAITNHRPSPESTRRPDEVDGIGELLKRRE